MSSSADSPVSVDDPRLRRAVQEYLEVLETGQRPDRCALAQRYPDLEAAMAPYLDALDLVHAASPGVALAETLDAPAEPLGDFRIVREIGRGGMGVVYEAIQRSLGRRVALKVLPFAAALDAKQLQRFKNEAQAAAQLHHPNIVPVYAVGVERGVHFYAMQLIEGQNLATLIKEMQNTKTRKNENTKESVKEGGEQAATVLRASTVELLSTFGVGQGAYFRMVARLLGQAAEGLEYAHGLGIVHRDVKPANLLLDGRGNVWVTDFGLAQFHADAGLTQSGDLLGTLRYMSPEQAGGQRTLIDQRTDVYALGATLYELLTLRPLFAGADRQALLHQILHEEPCPPRVVDRTIPVELETIALKALGKMPTERYGSARELADDLNRFLEDRPIRARRPTLVEKTLKWSRRHRAVVISAVVVLLLSVAALSIATVLIAGAYDRERQKAQEADEQRARAEASFRQARAAVAQFTEISEEFAGNPFLDGARRRLLETALDYYQAFIEQRQDDPTTQQELQTSRGNVQAILRELTTLMGAGQYAMLQDPLVRSDLQLTPEQRRVVDRLDASWRALFAELGQLSPAERQQHFLTFAQEQEIDLKKHLRPAQLHRLKQIAWQQRGPFAFSDPEVAEALALTAEQKSRVRELQADLGPVPHRFGPPPGGPHPGPPVGEPPPPP